MPSSSKTKSSSKSSSKSSKSKRQQSSSSSSSSPKKSSSSTSSSPPKTSTTTTTTTKNTLPSSGFLLTCDPPVKQFIKQMNETKTVDKKFIIEDLDATHLLIDGGARKEILRKVEEWMDENVFSNVERVGESLETG